ncbi:MAG: hypothetical protein Q8J99_01030 [Sulfuritalea sp.]|nr:hypothetical protein [Sulfuritalea sp.]
MLATTGKVGDTVGDGVDAFGFHDISCARLKKELYALHIMALGPFTAENAASGPV